MWMETRPLLFLRPMKEADTSMSEVGQVEVGGPGRGTGAAGLRQEAAGRRRACGP